jgi:hypothetical protein
LAVGYAGGTVFADALKRRVGFEPMAAGLSIRTWTAFLPDPLGTANHTIPLARSGRLGTSIRNSRIYYNSEAGLASIAQR